MTDEKDPNDDNALSRVMDQGAQLIRTDQSTLAALNRSEVEAQLDAAHRYPRVFSRFLREAETIACGSQEVAKSCMYTLKRRDKDGSTKHIIGPSIRMAEICATTYGNLHAGARPVDEDDTTVTCQGVCWDIERNVRVVTEVKRRITTTNGKRFNDDMVIVTMNACNSIAYRNAIFRVIPRALVDKVFLAVRETATGGKKPIEQKRIDIIAALNRIKVPTDRVLLTMGVPKIEDLTLEHLEVLIGYGTRVADGDSIDDVFDKLVPTTGAGVPAAATSPATPTPEGKRTPMRKPAAAAAEKPAAAAVVTPEQREQDTQDQAKAEREEERGDDPLRDTRKLSSDPGPSDADAPPWSTK